MAGIDCWEVRVVLVGSRGASRMGLNGVLGRIVGWCLWDFFKAREGIKKSGEFVVEFTKEHSHGAQDLGLLCEAFLAAWQLSSVNGRLVSGIGIIWTGVLQKKIVE